MAKYECPNGCITWFGEPVIAACPKCNSVLKQMPWGTDTKSKPAPKSRGLI